MMIWKVYISWANQEYVIAKRDFVRFGFKMILTYWGRVTHICVGNLNIIGSDNGLSPGRHQAIIWTNAGILLIGPLGTKFIEIIIEIQTFSSKKTHLKMSSEKWRPFCLGLNVLRAVSYIATSPPWYYNVYQCTITVTALTINIS